MKKLLSLPPNLVGCFHEITKHSPDEWFCCCDPSGTRLGSGGGTTWLLESCRRAEGPTDAEVWQNGQGRKKGYCCMPEGKDAGYLHMRPQARY